MRTADIAYSGGQFEALAAFGLTKVAIKLPPMPAMPPMQRPLPSPQPGQVVGAAKVPGAFDRAQAAQQRPPAAQPKPKPIPGKAPIELSAAPTEPMEIVRGGGIGDFQQWQPPPQAPQPPPGVGVMPVRRPKFGMFLLKN